MIEIRQAKLDDAPAMARVMIEAIVDAFRGRVPDQCLNWITPEESAANWARTIRESESAGLFVAADKSAGVVGLAFVRGIDDDPDYRADLASLVVDPGHQRRNIGRRLFQRTAEHLVAKEIDSLRVRVVRENPNRRFYERLGARFVREQPYDWNGVVLTELTYGWRDTHVLLARVEGNA